MILFVIKKFYDYNGYDQVSNGLRVSASFVVEMLKLEGHRAKLAEAIDGNCIDRLVTLHRPSVVVLEALWVTPAKMAELQLLHPGVRWVVRIHSEIPFLANEGIGIEWLVAYAKYGVEIGFNSEQAQNDFAVIGESIWLPNYYPLRKLRAGSKPSSEHVNIGCFGAIRPMKNQLIQALAAIRFAKQVGLKLRFHMNGTRVEQGGNSNLKSIQSALDASGNELVLHGWLEHEEFLDLIQQMDVCLQVSLSESFNIVSADAVSLGVPLIGSDAIRWLPRRSRALADSSDSIADKLLHADETTAHMNHEALENYVNASVTAWNEFL